ncbi:hypothetical protein [Hungatella hathewayi]|uniref:Uncharacterized protein n=1 Tax=Hungatella hathewayi TaxID=154046 RepID=A0AAW9WM93_9FIRM|nr:hypothetical protein [Hungatella hathewayi]MUB66500.1 hypothetical protein [Hungatella hathewayi]CUQ45833.1 Uncharacterised protein [Hungatella hathewayi]
MKIKIKECVGNSRIYGEDGKLAGTIEGWPKNGPVREICGTDGSVHYRVRKERGCCVIENRTEPQAEQEISVPFQYEERTDISGNSKGGGAAVLFRVPLAVKAVVPLTAGAVIVLQNRKREIVLEDREGRIGRITRIASLTGHEVECEKELDAYEAAVLFAAAEYMYHDDDIEMV